MRYGIYGGSFDPVHWGHLILAETCFRKLSLERIIFIPSGISPHKSKQHQISGKFRAEMLELAITGIEEFSVSRFEIEKEKTCYTIETIHHFRETLLDSELFLLVGADMYYDLPNWRQSKELLETVVPVGVYRPSSPPPHVEAFQNIVSPERYELFRQYIVSMPQIEISSTKIREAVFNDESIRFLTPRTVEAYIKSHNLYKVS
ncbi:MAG: nicotinate (nicotinamide) nucleotide adenylyltransferase [Planctomycetaceae bacterium]|jgi:nicotinate-nucleotide adenylyltransferase|nr:nicotinate (nicotinamide) nucleotide adenylyltransferase [Planctomycetaceae bacterium]